MRTPNILAPDIHNPPLDRAHLLRRDPEGLLRAEQHLEARYCLLWRNRHLVATETTTQLRWLSREEAGTLLANETIAESVVFLGLLDDRPRFALDLSSLEQPLDSVPSLGTSDLRAGDLGASDLGASDLGASDLGASESGAQEFLDLRQLAAILEAGEGNLAAYSRAIATWHQRHRFCGVCGSATTVREGGHLRACTNEDCGAQSFPRTDPAVIMLVHDGGDRCLLGRQASWPPGVFSALAGFVEPGESLEHSVAREVEEEVGIRIRSAQYHSSQPWPFPSSIMLGFWAEAQYQEAHPDSEEIEQAHWFERDELLRRMAERELRLPPRLSIARRLIDDWLREGPG